MLKAGAALCFAPAKSILKIAGPARSFNSQLPPRKMITPFTSRPIEREECVLDLKKPVQPEQVFVAAVEVKNEHLVQDDFKSLQKSVEKLEDTANSSSSDGNDWSDSKWQEERERRRERMEKNTKIAGFVMVGSAAAGAVSFALYYGRAERDRDGNIIHDQYSGALLAPFYRIYDSIWKWRDYVVEPSRNVLLPDPLPAPYLQPKYTIVIEMKNILVKPDWTYKTGYRFQKRPGLDYFLNVVGYPNFEVVIYTSESLTTAGPVLEAMDPNQRIMFKLFRDCTKYSEGHHKKDLSKLNRDLSKVIYIDFDANSGSLNPENMLMVPEWKGNNDDLSLVDLAELLKTIHLSDVEDVRPTIQYYSQFSNPAAEFKRRAAYVAAQQALGNEQQMEDPPVKKYAGRLFGYRRHMQI